MDEDSTKNLPVDRSLLEMILARLDAIETKVAKMDTIETRLDSIETRLTTIEEQNERRAIETKPIWERALSESLEVKEESLEIKEKVIETNERVGKIERQMTVLSKDVIEVRAEQFRLDNRIDKMESEPS